LNEHNIIPNHYTPDNKMNLDSNNLRRSFDPKSRVADYEEEFIRCLFDGKESFNAEVLNEVPHQAVHTKLQDARKKPVFRNFLNDMQIPTPNERSNYPLVYKKSENNSVAKVFCPHAV